MCPLSHSVDHTGDGRNEEAELLFTLSQFFSTSLPVPESADTSDLLHRRAVKDRSPQRFPWDREGSSWPPRRRESASGLLPAAWLLPSRRGFVPEHRSTSR